MWGFLLGFPISPGKFKPLYLFEYAQKIKWYTSKSKFILSEYNAICFNEIAFIGFTLHEIKQCMVFLGGKPGIWFQIKTSES